MRVLGGRSERVDDEQIEGLLLSARDNLPTHDSECRSVLRALEAMARSRGVNGFTASRRYSSCNPC